MNDARTEYTQLQSEALAQAARLERRSFWLSNLRLVTFLGALALGVGSNVFSRLMDRPSLVTIVPGVMLLVPGSVGYRSLESMMAQDVVAGLATAFSMFVVLVGLSAGILLSNALVPPRRGLV